MRAPFRLRFFTISASLLFFSGLSTESVSPQTVTPTPSVVARPMQSGSPTPAATPDPAQALMELQSRIRGRILSGDVRRGRVGIKIVTLNSGKVVFENDAEKYFMPASNMKNFTVAAAIERLTPDFKFVTRITAAAPPEPDGTLRGGLRMSGTGDISMSTTFDPAYPGTIDHYRAIDRIVDRIAAAGIKRIEGGLVGDESYFKGFAIPAGWEWDDLHTYYGTEVSALPLNDNVVDVSVRPGVNGSPCVITVLPQTQLVKIVNRCFTQSAGDPLRISKLINQNVVEVSGSVAASAGERREAIAFSHVAELFVDILRQRLAARGITVSGPDRINNVPVETKCAGCTDPFPFSIAAIESAPLSAIAAKTMKPSQNMYTETLLWTLGEREGRSGSAAGSQQLGLAAVKSFLKDAGIPADGIVQYDGSGLSRHNLITPSAVVALYTYMSKKSRYSGAWRESLTIAGVDGTLRNRFKGTAAEANFRGKTGTIDQVSALSGYMTTAAGEPLVVSIIINGVPTPRDRTSLIDDIVIELSKYKSRIE